MLFPVGGRKWLGRQKQHVQPASFSVNYSYKPGAHYSQGAEEEAASVGGAMDIFSATRGWLAVCGFPFIETPSLSPLSASSEHLLASPENRRGPWLLLAGDK